MSNTTLSVGLVSAAVIGYCIYFDHKRRSHPDFKKKLREKRRKLKQGGKNRTEYVHLSTYMRVFLFVVVRI